MRNLPWGFRAAHYFFILMFVTECFYAGFQVFVVLGGGPLFMRAASIDPDILMARRMYAIEGWLALGGLALYIGLTEVVPRRIAQVFQRTVEPITLPTSQELANRTPAFDVVEKV